MREHIKIKILQNLLLEVTKKYDEFISAQEEALEESLKKSIKDPLTGLYNRTFFLDFIKKISKKRNFGNKKNRYVFIFLDLDNFKYVNDKFGHKKGDEVLQGVAKILKEIFRSKDCIIRFGGDEFIIISNGNFNVKNLNEKLTILQKRVEERFKKFKISVSYGFAIYEEDSEDIYNLIRIADKRMYANKRAKKEIFGLNEKFQIKKV
jgi:diguanylate cyclase (GGDEF)-like protein